MAGTGQGGLGGNLPTAVKMAAIGLLIHQMMKSRDQGAAPAGQQGGGLGDILGGLLGGGRQAQPGPGGQGGDILGGILGGGGLGGLLGGLGGMLGGLRQQGMAEEVDSWIASGPNRPVPADKLAPAFDPAALDQAAREAGTDRGTLMDAMSRMLPEVVDRMTPQGRLPAADTQDDAGAFGSLLGSLGLGAPRR